METMCGLVIVLNGSSSSGKTSVAQALKSHLGSEVIYTGFDDILERVKPFRSTKPGMLGIMEQTIKIVRFNATDGRLKLFKQLHREVMELSKTGHSIIVETALMDRRALCDAAVCFAPLNGFFVGLKPPLAVAERWESTRQDRPPGQARKHYALIHQYAMYDLELDPSNMTPDECADTISELVSTTSPHAFQQLVDDL